eukprot:2591891-Alexandrium_andersonii.AAC.1
MKPVHGLQPALVGEVGYGFWQGGDFIKDGQFYEGIPEFIEAMREGVREYVASELFSAMPTADDLNMMSAHSKHLLSHFGPRS